jgi:hypothetical protein
MSAELPVNDLDDGGLLMQVRPDVAHGARDVLVAPDALRGVERKSRLVYN